MIQRKPKQEETEGSRGVLKEGDEWKKEGKAMRGEERPMIKTGDTDRQERGRR